MKSSLIASASLIFLTSNNLYAEESNPPRSTSTKKIEQLQCHSRTTTDVSNANQQVFENLLTITDTISQMAKQISTHHQENADIKTSDESWQQVWNWFFKYIGVATVLSFLANIVMWQNSVGQRKLTEKSLEISHKALFDVQRAFVFIRIETENVYGGVNFSIIWENSGSTPTEKLIINHESRKYKQERSKDLVFVYRNSDDTTRVLAPKSVIKKTFFIPKQQLEALEKKEFRMYIWAKSEYWDIFTRTISLFGFDRTISHKIDLFEEIIAYRCENGLLAIGTPAYPVYNQVDGKDT